ncbi:MAG: hypothetical protein LQ343_003256 [Gyalolechia ehrenbergii]|nr:MAG: hypothetical protein LQ343_003256 [Gyalolechia ehrenbergii]
MGQLGDLSPQASVAVGIFAGLASTSIQSLGLTLQRKSHILEDEKEPHDPRRPPFRRRRWQLGMLMFIVSNIVGSSIQITTLPLPVLSTLQASGLVFNSICATLILGEPFTRWSLSGTLLVCAGAVLIARYGAIGEPAHSLDQLLALLGRQQFILWMVATAVVIVAVIIGAKAVTWINPRGKNSPQMRLLRGMAYGCISGILSAHSLLVAKSAVELLVRTIIDRNNQFNRWQSWIILLGLLFLALSQLYYLHRGLKLCSTSTLILLLGVLVLSWRLNDPSARAPAPQTPLTPGMGFVDSDSDSGAETSLVSSGDEEALQAATNGQLSSPILKTPTARSNELYGSTRWRSKSITETEEVLEELEDDTLPELFSPTLPRRRRSSAMSTPSKGIEDSGNGEHEPDESTALLGRTGTGRSYRDRKRRRRSELSVTGSRRRHESTNTSQEWWKMGWWRGKDGKRKEADVGGNGDRDQ